MSLSTGSRIGIYEILEPLGAGGMGEVYRAHDARLRRDVAIKVLAPEFTVDPERLARFEREARALAALNHPNIATIYGVEEVGGTQALVMELVEGETLSERIARSTRNANRPLWLADLLGLARQLARALDAAHTQGIVHRDLKPDNIMITPAGTVKVLDFGIAKIHDPNEASQQRATTVVNETRIGTVLGTAAYMSPEQARGLPVDKRTDVWAFGCVLYEMLTGRAPFDGATATDTLAAVLEHEPDWTLLPIATPATIRPLLQRCLQKDLHQRLRDVGDIGIQLEDAVAPEPRVPAAEDSRARGRRTFAVAATTLALLAVGGLLVVRYFGSAPELQAAPATPVLQTGRAVVAQLTNYGGAEWSGALAPDGRSFVFVSSRETTPDIWLRQTSGGDPVRLTNDAAVESDLVYSPDGDSIYYTRRGGDDTSIWQIGAIGANARRLVRNAQMPSPSRDGAYLAWFVGTAAGGYDLTVGGADGSQPRVIVSAVPMQTVNRPSWSPDHRRLAYSAGDLFQTRNLFLASVEDGQVRQVTRFTRSTEGPVAQDWLPDNRHLVIAYFASPRSQLVNDLGILDVETGDVARMTMNVTGAFEDVSLSADGARLIATVREDQREVWKVPFGDDPEENGRAAVRIVDATQDPMWTYVTRDGRTLLFNNARAGSRNLWLLPLAGEGRPRQLTQVAGDAVMHSSLSPDGTRVAFVSSTSGNADIWVQNVDGSSLRQLTNDPLADAWPAWSPDGQRIMFASTGPGGQETRVISAEGGPAERFADGFFRGDWIRNPAGAGTRMVTSNGRGGIRLYDVESRQVLWEDRAGPGLSLPMFSADGSAISVPLIDASQRSTIAIYDTATGARRVAVRFNEPFEIFFRASWMDGDGAFAVNRNYSRRYIVLFDRLSDETAVGR
jgi:Tol biopolymer transport system component